MDKHGRLYGTVPFQICFDKRLYCVGVHYHDRCTADTTDLLCTETAIESMILDLHVENTPSL